MIYLLDGFFKKRKIWLLSALIAFLLELVALYLQHIILLEPCVLCIYERCALYGILIASLLGASTNKKIIRFVATLFWLYSAWQGLLLSIKHINIQSHPTAFFTCNLYVSFPNWLPLDKWLPSMFSASNYCSEYQQYFLLLEISEWMMIIFIIYIVIAITILFIQFLMFFKRKYGLFVR